METFFFGVVFSSLQLRLFLLYLSLFFIIIERSPKIIAYHYIVYNLLVLKKKIITNNIIP